MKIVDDSSVGQTGKCVVMVACASAEEGRAIAGRLVEKKLAACVQMVPGVESTYRWEGKVVTGQEVLLLIKTGGTQWKALEAEIRAAHSHAVPEILAVPVTAGLTAYLAWMDGALG
jgi:periplasmic divalent cation tolerance protein